MPLKIIGDVHLFFLSWLKLIYLVSLGILVSGILACLTDSLRILSIGGKREKTEESDLLVQMFDLVL